MIPSRRSESHLSCVSVGNRSPTADQAIRRSLSGWTAVAAITVSFVFTNSAHAADGTAPAAVPDPLATQLFQDAVTLIEKNEWKEGCAKFEASMALYSAPSTLLNIARCYEHDGKLSLAWSAYQRALVINRETQPPERKKELDDVATRGLAAIEPRLPRLKIIMTGTAPTGLRVTQNGKDVPVAVLGTPIPVDPGQQSVVAEAPEFEPFTQAVTVKEGDLVEISVVLKKRVTTLPVVTTPAKGIPMWAWISAGGGLAFLMGAAAFRVDQAFVEGKQEGWCQGDVLRSCPSKEEYDPAPDNARKNRDNAAFIGLGTVGVIGLGAAITGIVMGSRQDKPTPKTAVITPWVSSSDVGVSVGGRF
jgi:hypothetical protein